MLIEIATNRSPANAADAPTWAMKKFVQPSSVLITCPYRVSLPVPCDLRRPQLGNVPNERDLIRAV